MKSETFEFPSQLAERFQELQDTLNAFTAEAAELHRGITVNDDASRALFTALSRVTAFSEQLQMVLALMGEDICVAEEIGSVPGGEFELDEHENCFYEWLRTSRKGGVTVN